MSEEEFDLYIEDEDGKVIMDEKVRARKNGFIDLWLPRDKTYTVRIGHRAGTAEAELSTFENDGTCVTDIQLM